LSAANADGAVRLGVAADALAVEGPACCVPAAARAAVATSVACCAIGASPIPVGTAATLVVAEVLRRISL
jgi:hypothetical protein